MTLIVSSEQCSEVAIARNTADVGVQRFAFDPLTLAAKVPNLAQIRYDTIRYMQHL